MRHKTRTERVYNEAIGWYETREVELKGYSFSNAKKGKVSIPAPASRKDEYLDIARMTELYQVFVNKNYPDTWKKGGSSDISSDILIR